MSKPTLPPGIADYTPHGPRVVELLKEIDTTLKNGATMQDVATEFGSAIAAMAYIMRGAMSKQQVGGLVHNLAMDGCYQYEMREQMLRDARAKEVMNGRANDA